MITPSTVANFVANNFDFLSKLYYYISEHQTVKHAELLELCSMYEGINIQLLEKYKIIKEYQKNEYALSLPVRDFIAFCSKDFSLNSPESIKKYQDSLKRLHQNFHSFEDKNMLVVTLRDINKEIDRFIEELDTMINSLLKEARDLKSNRENYNYIERYKKATKLIDRYIIPINSILEQHDNSVYTLLMAIQNDIHTLQFRQSDHNILDTLYKSKIYISNAINSILKNSNVILKELLPLAKGVKKSSQLVRDAVVILENIDSLPSMSFGKKVQKDILPVNFARNSALDIIDAQKSKVQIYINTPPLSQKQELFNTLIYEQKLTEQLPIENILSWFYQELKKDDKLNRENFISLFGLLTRYRISISNERINLQFKNEYFDVPVMRAKEKKDEISK